MVRVFFCFSSRLYCLPACTASGESGHSHFQYANVVSTLSNGSQFNEFISLCTGALDVKKPVLIYFILDTIIYLITIQFIQIMKVREKIRLSWHDDRIKNNI